MSRRRKQLCLLGCGLMYLFVVYTLNKDGTLRQNTENFYTRISYEYNRQKRDVSDKKITHLSFLKVPKTGSSTLQNVIFRLSYKNNLSVYLPKDKYVVSLDEQKAIMSQPITYDVFLIHTIYNREFFQSNPASATISLIRRPFERTISAAYFMRDIVHVKYLEKIPKANYIESLLGNWKKYDKNYFSPTRNLMGKYFGFTKQMTPKNANEIEQYLNEVNSDIALVLILERFDESLVLLRKLMHWSFADILYLKLNAHKHEKVEVDERLQEVMKTTCFLDDQIYEYFTNELDKKIAQAGEMFQSEVSYFLEILDQVKEFCTDDTNKNRIVIPESTWEDEFEITQDDCEKMKTNDIDFFQMFRSRQESDHSS